MKRFSFILFLLILLCFFLPFVNISCNGQSISTVSGVQLIFGSKEQVPQENINGTGTPDFFIAAAFACSIAGIIFALFNKDKLILLNLIFSLIIFISLLIFQIRGSRMLLGEQTSGTNPEIHYEYGYWLAVILSAFTFVSFFMQFSSSKNRPDK